MEYYTIDEIEKELKEKINDKCFNEWFSIVKPYINNNEFQKRRLFLHHKNSSVWQHSINVSFKAFKYAKKIGADKRVCAIAGLFHDFYPQAWLYSEELYKFDASYLKRIQLREPLFQKHGFTHAREAYDNFIKYFPEEKNKKIENCIKRHMFPLNIVPPKYKESWIITFTDKQDSIKDTFYIIQMLFKH